MARKPFNGTVAKNVLEWGTGGINIDECRVGTDEITTNGYGMIKDLLHKKDMNHQHIKVDFLQTLSLMKKQVRYLMNRVGLVNHHQINGKGITMPQYMESMKKV